jgi:hypothetical protein
MKTHGEEWDQVRVRFIAAALTGLLAGREGIQADGAIDEIATLAVQLGSATCAELDEWLAS